MAARRVDGSADQIADREGVAIEKGGNVGVHVPAPNVGLTYILDNTKLARTNGKR